jgi:23S rRNA (adenine2503-C2)-methyltransferase
MSAVIRDASRIWLSHFARRAGFPGSEQLARAYALRPYRLRQLYRGACKELVGDVENVTVLPKVLRESLDREGVALDSVTPVAVRGSRDGQTTKALFRLHDDKEVEAVLMEHSGERTTVCISSQAGCAFACAFCSTGQAGFGRNLSAVEIFDQVRFFARRPGARPTRVTNVVFMGMGEPFHNY